MKEIKIGLLSDTHSFWDDRYSTLFSECDEIWHAGDIGHIEILEKLEAHKKVYAVYGNIDGNSIRIRTSEHLIIRRNDVTILITHIAGKCPTYTSEVRKLISKYQPKVLIAGHSHILQILPDRQNNLLFINPGAAGIHGFHRMRTMVRFGLVQGKVTNMEVIELGLRSQLMAGHSPVQI